MSISTIDFNTIKSQNNTIANTKLDRFVRNPEWIALSFNSGDEKAIGLFAISENSYNAVALQATVSSGSVYVDWGDGTNTTVASNTTAQRTYNFNDFDNSTLTSDGYKQVIITVTPTVAGALTNVNYNIKPTVITTQTTPAIDWLEFKMGGPNFIKPLSLSDPSTLGTVGSVRFLKLENFEVLNGSLATQNLNGLFNSACPNLRQFKFISRTDQTAQSTEQWYYTFANCYNLITIEVQVPNNILRPRGFSYTFYDCRNLRRIPAIDYSGFNLFTQVFVNNYNLGEVGHLNFGSALTDGTAAFSNCSGVMGALKVTTSATVSIALGFDNISEIDVTINGSRAPAISSRNLRTAIVTLNTTSIIGEALFAGCSSLVDVKFVGTGSFAQTRQMFSGCSSLESLDSLPVNQVLNQASVYDLTFSNCFNLKYVPSLNMAFTGSAINRENNTFNNCYSLRKIEDPSAVTALTSYPSGQLFNNNFSLEEIPAFKLISTQLPSSGTSNFFNLKRFRGYGMTGSLTVSHSKLSTVALNELIENLGTSTGTPALTITASQGAIESPAVTKTAGALDTTSYVVPFSDTSNLEVGMQGFSSGAGLSGSYVGANITASTDFVSAPVPVNGSRVSFTTASSGLSAYTPYWVVNAEPSNGRFKLSLTQGGAPINLTADASGLTMLFMPTIVAIVPNVSVEFDIRPSTNTSGLTFTFRKIKTLLAVMKKFTVTG